MATLLLKDNAIGIDSGTLGALPTLRTWLGDGWALLYSHPQDFLSCELEADRWLAVMRAAFGARGVRPLAVAHRACEARDGWIARVSADDSLVALTRPGERRGDVIDLHAHALRDDIERLGDRFVLVIDSLLRRRRTFAYRSLHDLPSPLDFLAWIDRLRAVEAAPEPPAPALTRHDRPRPPARRHCSFSAPRRETHARRAFGVR
jgi:hypothetical protein